MRHTVDYYFAPQSPWTYLGHERFAMRSEPLLPRFAEQNARTAIILQVEDPRGAAAADEIASMPGVARSSR